MLAFCKVRVNVVEKSLPFTHQTFPRKHTSCYNDCQRLQSQQLKSSVFAYVDAETES
ncbi:hypothetical protein Q3G72_022570 [Acer saccharum]|nr:hypothetical protein Q3G72_022570 [Acer saccharum]